MRTNAEIGAECQAVASRTVRAVTLKFVRLGLLERAYVFPGHKFRVAEKAQQRNQGYLDRLYFAADVFGVALSA